MQEHSLHTEKFNDKVDRICICSATSAQLHQIIYLFLVFGYVERSQSSVYLPGCYVVTDRLFF